MSASSILAPLSTSLSSGTCLANRLRTFTLRMFGIRSYLQAVLITLALPDGTYELEFRYGGPGTGIHEMSASFTVTIVSPPDVLFLTMVAGIVFFSAAGLAVTRKILRGRVSKESKPVSPELRKALEEERDSIPERVREHTERRIAELDEVSHGAEETSELSSTTESGSPPSPETGTEGDGD